MLRAGKLISISSYLLSVALTYILALRLWKSKVIAGTAALLFSLSRGIAFEAVAMVTPDLLFGVFALLHFIVLIDCLENDRRWFSLGAIHALAFLAKAFALPWLAVTTLIAALALTGSAKQKLNRVLSAAVVPIVFACLWVRFFTLNTECSRQEPSSKPISYSGRSKLIGIHGRQNTRC